MDNKTIWDEKWSILYEYCKNSAGNRWAFYLIRELLRLCKQPALVLDIGCGIGSKTSVIADYFPSADVKGIDFSVEGIEAANRAYVNVPNLKFECMDAEKLSELCNSSDSEVELITAFEVLEHIEDWESILDQMCSLSKRYIMISTPTGRMRHYEKDLGHYRNFKKGQIEEKLYSNGFEKIEVFYAGFPFWSPITRDLIDLSCRNKGGQKDSSQFDVKISRLGGIIHSLVFILYRYLSFVRIGDQFMGLFQKIEKEE